MVKLVETKKPGDATEAELQIREVNTGIYAFEATVPLGLTRSELGNENAQGEYYLPDLLSILRGDGNSLGASLLDDPWEMIGVNDRQALAAVTPSPSAASTTPTCSPARR